jgi:hypothetical protein
MIAGPPSLKTSPRSALLRLRRDFDTKILELLFFYLRVKWGSGDGPQIKTLWGLRFSARIYDEQRR